MRGNRKFELPEGASANTLAPANLIDPDGFIARETARDHFVETLNDVASMTVNDLPREPYLSGCRLLARLTGHLRQHPDDVHYVREGDRVHSPSVGNPDLAQGVKEYRSIVDAWAKRHRLNVDWIERIATQNIHMWWVIENHRKRHGQDRSPDDWIAENKATNVFLPWINKEMEPFRSALSSMVAEPVRIVFDLTWDPQRESRRLVRADASRELQRLLEQALDHIETVNMRAGDRPVPVRKNLSTHCTWLVRWQVLKQSYAQIADDPQSAEGGVSPQAVGRAIKEVAALIDLPLRSPGLGGRKPKRHARTIQVGNRPHRAEQ